MTGLLVWQAVSNAPTSDEAAHLIAGVAIVQTGDPAFYRVNPPLHKLVSGVAVDLTTSCQIAGLYSASMFGSGNRQEFEMAKSTLAQSPEEYPTWFLIGRLVRLPVILFAAWLMLGQHLLIPQRAGVIASVSWLTSPMVLGQGWAIMPDAFSACAAAFLLVTTAEWLTQPNRWSFLFVGIAWGFAIGTKFTFCPLFVLWPLGMLSYRWAEGALTWRSVLRLSLAHFGHGMIALFVVAALYNFSELGLPLGSHRFESSRMISLSEPLATLPSPLPKQFLIGIDEQQLDIEGGLPTYFKGRWYPAGMWWYYLVGLLAKEQIVFGAGLSLACVGGALMWLPTGIVGKYGLNGGTTQRKGSAHHRTRILHVATGSSAKTANQTDAYEAETVTREMYVQTKTKAFFVLCLYVATCVLFILSWHSEMALNVRYAFPALPALYFVIGIGVDGVFRRWPATTRWVLGVGLLLITAELSWNTPHFFAYVNPLFGGSRAVPPVLHDSNFDGGQDLWRLEAWITAHPSGDECMRFTCVDSDVPASAMNFKPTPPPPEVIERLIARRATTPGTGVSDIEHDSASYRVRDGQGVELITMRGLGVPAPWARMSGHASPATHKALIRLLAMPPDEFITPTLVIYRD